MDQVSGVDVAQSLQNFYQNFHHLILWHLIIKRVRIFFQLLFSIGSDDISEVSTFTILHDDDVDVLVLECSVLHVQELILIQHYVLVKQFPQLLRLVLGLV